MEQNQRNHLFYFTHSSFLKHAAAYITHNATECHHWRQSIRYLQPPQDPQKALYNFFPHINKLYALPVNTL